MNNQVILINCSQDITDLDSSTKENQKSSLSAVQGKSFPPLGLLYIGAMLEKNDINVDLIDLSLLEKSVFDLVRDFQDNTPKLIGFYVSTFNLYWVYRIIKMIRKSSIKTKIVIGGPHVHYCPEAVRHLNADYGFVSDGEYGFMELAKRVLKNQNKFDDIDNLIQNIDGRIKTNSVKQIDNLDQLPYPARHLWPHNNYFSPLVSGKTTAAITSRGCIFNCSFCALPNKGILRMRSCKNIIGELQSLKEQGYRYVEFQDDFFTYDRNRTIDICNQILKRKINLKWTCLTRVDFVDDYLLGLMRKAGCTHIKYGIESGSERIRNKIMKKQITNLKIKETIMQTKAKGIMTVGYFLLGAESEILEDIKLTLKFARDLKLDYVDFNIIAMIPGSDIFNNMKKKHGLDESIWQKIAEGKKSPYFYTDQLNLSILNYWKQKAMREHYFSFNFLFKEVFIRTRNISSFLNKTKILLNFLTYSKKTNQFERIFEEK